MQRHYCCFKTFWKVSSLNYSQKTFKMKLYNDMINDAKNIYQTATYAVKPDELIRNAITIKSNNIHIYDKQFSINRNAYIVGFGKAVLGMTVALENIMQDHLISGVISIPSGMPDEILRDKLKTSRIKVFEGAKNNIPDYDSLLASNEISKLVSSLEESSLLFVLISGGGSALLPSPKPPLTLEEKQFIIKTLASKGATIEEINVVRKKLSLLKGGGLALLAKCSQVISLILSDIIDDPLGLIASGPTVENMDDPSLPLAIIEKYKVRDVLPQSALKLLNNDTSEKHLQEKKFEFVSNFIIGSNSIALKAAAEKAEDLNYIPIVMTNKLCGLANDTGKKIVHLIEAVMLQKVREYFLVCETLDICKEKSQELLDIAKMLNSNKGLCVLFGGETTVQVKGGGIGGRNQELALSASIELKNVKLENSVVLLSAGTDGIDGPTDAAGAMATSSIVAIANDDGMDAQNFLDNNDSYTFYNSLQNGLYHVKIGHTGTNVMDIIIVLIKKV